MKKELKFDSVAEKLQNHTEELVLETMEELLEEDEFQEACTCEQCLLDIATYALNRLPAKYVASHKGDLYTKIQDFEQQASVDVIQTVTRAIEIVSENPHKKE